MKRSLISIGAAGAMFVFAWPASVAAQDVDMEGLDLTLEVLGADEQIDDQIVNKIAIPGILPGGASSNGHANQADSTVVNGVTGVVGGTVSGVGDVVEGVLESLGGGNPRDH